MAKFKKCLGINLIKRVRTLWRILQNLTKDIDVQCLWEDIFSTKRYQFSSN